MASPYVKPLSAIPQDVLRAVFVMAVQTDTIPDAPTELPRGATLAGSVSNKLYPFFGDVDAVQSAEFSSVEAAADAVQRVVQKICHARGFTFVEFKAGSDACLQFLKPRCWIEKGKVRRWNLPWSLARIRDAEEDGACSASEKDAWSSTFRSAGKTCPPDKFPAILDIDPWKLRWSATDILRGFTRLQHGDIGILNVSLEDALQQPALVKMDARFWSVSQHRFLDISMIYSFEVRGKPINDSAKLSPPPELSLKQDVWERVLRQDYVKATKRLLSLCIVLGRDADIASLRDIVVSDVGRAAAVSSDCETLRGVLDDPYIPHAKVLVELQGIRERISKVYGLCCRHEATALRACRAAMDAEATPSGVRAMKAQLDHVQEMLKKWYEPTTEELLKKEGFLPLPAWALP